MIIVIDNTSIYYNLADNVLEALVDIGLSIEYLPLYLPDYNSIEMTFNTLKL